MPSLRRIKRYKQTIDQTAWPICPDLGVISITLSKTVDPFPFATATTVIMA